MNTVTENNHGTGGVASRKECKFCHNDIPTNPRDSIKQRLARKFCNVTCMNKYQTRRPTTRTNVIYDCVECGTELGNPWSNKTGLCRKHASIKRQGINHPLWTETPSYITIHYWLYRNFGRANKCQNKECNKKSKTFDWALLKEKKYERIVENFVQLCRSCHVLYDNYCVTITL